MPAEQLPSSALLVAMMEGNPAGSCTSSPSPPLKLVAKTIDTVSLNHKGGKRQSCLTKKPEGDLAIGQMATTEAPEQGCAFGNWGCPSGVPVQQAERRVEEIEGPICERPNLLFLCVSKYKF